MKSLLLSFCFAVCALAHTTMLPPAEIPASAPRTMIVAGRHEAFRAYCTTGEGAKAFARIRDDLDRDYLAMPFPDEPLTYGDPAPGKRDSDKADKWRHVQDITGRISGVAEAATLCWIVTGEEKYLAKAKDFLLRSCDWHFAPEWQKGPVVGSTDIHYNDEAHFRLWRKMPLVYDQLRDHLSPAERKKVLAHFRTRGTRSAEWIELEGSISKIRPNSIEAELSSHPVRFMPMTGISALALWDDLPEARDWWRFAERFYREQFTPWGGDDGGWAEGVAYWRGTMEHAAFQDALFAIGYREAYNSPFWRNTPLFAIYNIQPYAHTSFGDVSNAGHFNLEPVVADFMEHLARMRQEGMYLTYAQLCRDTRPRQADKGLSELARNYPTAAEFLVRNFVASERPMPAPRPLTNLPPYRHFRDIGWVSLHSALGKPDDDIHVTFKSSPYGSFSHSHADQNAFILNAYGENLAINSSYREFHNSRHHREWTRQTVSKNALLIDGVGQKAQSKSATGRITRFEPATDRVWTTGDATKAYAASQPKGRVRNVTRDLVFVDQRYVVIRDRVELATPGKVSWLLHAEKAIVWDAAQNTGAIPGPGGKATLSFAVVSDIAWTDEYTTEFPVAVDAKYRSGEVTGSYLTGRWDDQAHLTLESGEAAKSFTIFSVMWPERGTVAPRITAQREGNELVITRPDGKMDRVRFE